MISAMPAGPVDVHEIHHVAEPQPVDQVARRAAHHECHAHAGQAVDFRQRDGEHHQPCQRRHRHDGEQRRLEW
jgi:hypothetical protein